MPVAFGEKVAKRLEVLRTEGTTLPLPFGFAASP